MLALAGHNLVIELVDRLHCVAAVELIPVEVIALAIVLLTVNIEEEG